MLIDRTRNELKSFVQSESVDLKYLRSEVVSIVKEVFGKIVFPNFDKLDDFGRDLEKLMAIGLDLAESSYQNLLNGNLTGACHILRAQVIISQQAFVFSKSGQHYENWKAGINIKESQLRKFIKLYQSKGKTPKYDPSEDTYSFYSDLFHLKHKRLNHAYTISTLQYVDDSVKSDTKLLIYESLKYAARVLLTSIEYLDSKGLIVRSKHEDLANRWNALDKDLTKFKKRLDQKRKELEDQIKKDA